MDSQTPFYDRKVELDYLSGKFKDMKGGELIVVYGRRRLGKTRLLKKFMEKAKAASLYFYVNLAEETELKTIFQEDVNRQAHDVVEIKQWPDLFDYLESKAKDEPLIVIIDEFQRFRTVAPAFITQLQNYWDSKLKDRKLFLVLVGSSIGMMKKITDSGAGPLYGRKTGQVDLKPFQYADFREAFPKLTEEERVNWYAVFGGTPFYVELSQKHETLWAAVEEEILKSQAVLREEPKNMLEFELRAIARYNSILHAIASGKQTIKEISDLTGIKAQSLPVYIKTLQENLNLVQMRQPLFGKRNMGRYAINDPFFAFWYRFVTTQSAELEIGQTQKALDRIQQDISMHSGRVFERIVRELFIRYNNSTMAGMTLDFSKIGSWWNKQGEEIDLVIPNSDGLILVEVKWRNQPVDSDVLENLVRKAHLVQKPGLRKFVLVSKSGFTEGCKKMAEQKKAVLLDLSDIERLYQTSST